MSLLVAAFLLAAAFPLIGSVACVWLLVASQLSLLVAYMMKRQVSGAGAFVFMSFLFFGVRPIYLLIENDYFLFTALFMVRVGIEQITDSMWWATAAMVCFVMGARFAPNTVRKWLQLRRSRAASAHSESLVSDKMCYALIFFQLLTLPIMFFLARAGRSLYGSAAGAYAYDLPVPLQSVHIITVVVLLERYLRRKSTASLVMLLVSGFLFLDFTWLMREVSAFRGFYIAGVMIAGIAVLQRIKGRVGYAWLILPIVLLQPFFQYLGQVRGADNRQLAESGVVAEVFDDRSVLETYWRFYESRGDMNIFDTFVAAKQTEPLFYAYAWSWAYVPLHLIPRAVWPGKPKRGITMDMSFARKFPYSPGIAGFFLRDGGVWWMLLSMFVLGYLISLLDAWVFTLPRGYLQYCLIGIVTINAMFLTRFFLWQYFYQMLYAMIPIVALSWWFARGAKMNAASVRNQRRSIRGVVATD